MRGRYYTLDGLRGIGALWVVLLHFAPTFGLPAPTHGYLAVDLFFCLSGFVLTRAYAHKIENGMSFAQWIKVRLIRLYPLFLLSMLLGFSATGIAGMPGSQLDGPHRALALGTGLLMLPAPTSMPEMFPLNFVAWSLFIEMLLSIAFFWSSRWNNRSVWLLLLIGLAGLIAVRLLSGYIGGGFAWRDAPSGFARGLFGFSAGMLVARYHNGNRRTTSLAWLPMIAAAALMSMNPPHGTAYDMLAVIMLIPALVAISVRVEPNGKLIPTVAGDLSYAIYVLHSVSFFAFERLTGHSPEHPSTPAIGALFLSSFLALCWAIDRYGDSPVRERLPQRVSAVNSSM